MDNFTEFGPSEFKCTNCGLHLNTDQELCWQFRDKNKKLIRYCGRCWRDNTMGDIIVKIDTSPEKNPEPSK